MGFFDVISDFPAEESSFWSHTEISKFLINGNQPLAEAGYSMRLSYPYQDAVDNLNMGLIKGGSGNLAATIIADCKAQGIAFNRKTSNWCLLVAKMLEQTIWYMETPSAKYRTKCFATRNLEVANAQLSSPIANFNLLNSLLMLDYSYFATMRQRGEIADAVYQTLCSVINQLSSCGSKPSAQILEWLSSTFNADVKLIKIFVECAAYLRRDYSDCAESKVAFIKLKPTADGHFEMPSRVTGVAYKVTDETIIVPVTFMRKQAKTLLNMLKQGIVVARFKRDNDVLRDLVATSNTDVLSHVFKKPENCSMPSEYIEDRGYIRTVDLCSSEINADVSRAISLARVTGINFIQPDFNTMTEQLKPFGFDPTLAQTDLGSVVEKFKHYLESYKNNLRFLQMIYDNLTHGNPSHNYFQSPVQGVIEINDYVDMQVCLTSSFTRTLHMFMLNNPMLFPGYSGKVDDLGGYSISSKPKFASLGTVGSAMGTQSQTFGAIGSVGTVDNK